MAETALRSRSTRTVVALLLAALAPLALDGCVSVGLRREPAPSAPETGSVAVAVYEKARDRDAGQPLSTPVFSRLLRVEKERGERVVARAMSSRWRLGDLPPGRYRLEATRRIDAAGDVVPLGEPVAKAFDLEAGQQVKVDVVLSKVPVLLIVLAVITVVLLVVLAIDAIGDSDVPIPPPPPPEVVAIAADVVLDAVTAAAASRALAPGAADAFPAPGSVVAARRVTVSFLLTAPLGPGGLAEGAVLALGSESGEIPGKVSWLPEEQALLFAPARDFTPGETVTVTLDLGKLEGPGGAEGSGRFSTRFTVAGADEE